LQLKDVIFIGGGGPGEGGKNEIIKLYRYHCTFVKQDQETAEFGKNQRSRGIE